MSTNTNEIVYQTEEIVYQTEEIQDRIDDAELKRRLRDALAVLGLCDVNLDPELVGDVPCVCDSEAKQ